MTDPAKINPDQPMTDDEFRAWALGEAQSLHRKCAEQSVDEWVRTQAPDELTIGSARDLKRMVLGFVDIAIKAGFNAGTSRSGPKVK